MGARPTATAPFAYVSNSSVPLCASGGAVSVVDTGAKPPAVAATVVVGTCPAGVAITPDGKHAYVANQTSGTVSVIDAATNTVVATIPFVSNTDSPIGVAITPDGKYAYVTKGNPNTVSVIATATNLVVATIPVGVGTYGVAVTPDGKYAYVTSLIDNTVLVIATASNTVVGSPIPVGNSPEGVAVTPDGTHVYVANFGLTGTVTVIETATNTVVATVPVGRARSSRRHPRDRHGQQHGGDHGPGGGWRLGDRHYPGWDTSLCGKRATRALQRRCLGDRHG